MNDLQNIVQHPLFGIAGLLIGALGLISGFVIFFLGRRVKKPCWVITSNNLIAGFSAKLPKLEIKYLDQKVENLTSSKVVFWNAGRETIDGSDIADADPLRIIAIGDVKILDAKLLLTNNDSSNCLLATKPDATEVYLRFDFLDSGHGGVVQVIHTGRSSESIHLTGTIKGAGKPVKQDVQPNMSIWSYRGFLLLFAAMCLLFLAMAVVSYIGFMDDGKNTSRIVIGVLGFLFFGCMFLVFLRKVPVPGGLAVDKRL